MLPAVWAILRTYAPVITIPFAAVVGVLGYALESVISDKYTPYRKSIEEQREDRQLQEVAAEIMEQPKNKVASKARPKPHNIKKENLEELIRRKKEYEKKAHEIVLRLIESPVEKEYLIENAINISKQHMEDVIEERKLGQLCGWVLCDNKIDPQTVPKQKYSIKGHKVFDITERKSFCGGRCYAKASHFKAQLLTSPLWLRDMEEEVHFEVLEDFEAKELHGMTVALSSIKLTEDSESEEENADNPDKAVRNENPREEDEGS